MNMPTATYRIQFNPAFGYQAARPVISYLADLGISDLYVSPIFKAVKGSLHGYDVVDPNHLNPELGGLSDLEGLAAELRTYNMGWIQDVVPNHMAIDSENRLPMDILENGSSSRYFQFFDVDWDYPAASLNCTAIGNKAIFENRPVFSFKKTILPFAGCLILALLPYSFRLSQSDRSL